MLVLGFTDQQIEDMYGDDVEEWSVDEQKEIIRDAARSGGFDRIYGIYTRAGGEADHETYLMYFANGARQYDMIPEALAILRQASKKELEFISYRAEAPLRELVTQVQKEHSYPIKLAAGLGLVSIIAASATYLWITNRRPSAWPSEI